MIVLDGGKRGTLAVTGTLDASSSAGRGGKIDIRGRKLEIGEGALVEASGAAGGGDIRIGGDRGGQGPGRNADRVILAPEARIIADATEIGDGGSIIVYGKETARINGQLTARGGPHGGDGGFVETSAAGTIEIAAEVEIDASAPAGEPGTWLIDPTDITIGIPDDPGTTVANTILESVLQTGNNVEVDTSQPPYGNASDSGAGNITVAASIQPNLTEVYGNQQVILTLTADNNVTINSGATIGPTNTDAGSSMGVTITAGRNITNNGTIDVAAGLGGAVNLTAASNIALGRINAGAGDITITATTGAVRDNTVAEPEIDSPNNENLVGGAINLTAGQDIGGAVGGNNIDIAATSLDATVTGSGGGGIFIAETDNLALGRVDAITGDITLTAGGAITDVNSRIKEYGSEEENLVGGVVSLTTGGGIGASGDGDIDTAVTGIDAQTTSGGIFIASIL